MQKFMQGAKQYGIVYCVLRDKKHDKDGMCDVLVKADDAPKISRLVERFKFATVDKAKIESEIVKTKAEKAQDGQPLAGTEQPTPDKNDTEKLLDDLLGTPEGKAEPDAQDKAQPEKTDTAKTTPVKEARQNPGAAPAAKSRPSEPTSESKSKSAGVTSSDKPSVKEELREIAAVQKSSKEADAPKREDKAVTDKPRAASATTHRQPPRGGKSKSKKTKER